MDRAKLESFISYLQKENWLVFGPTELTPEPEEKEEISPYIAAHLPETALHKKGRAFIDQIQNPAELILDERLPFYPFKRFFVPECEALFEYQGAKLKSPLYNLPPFLKGGEVGGFKKIALVGVNILDLKAINLYDQVFEKDPYYQARRRKILIIGFSALPETDDNIFEYIYKEDILEHLPFDIFLPTTDYRLPTTAKKFKVFSGSIKGQRILEHFGYKNYQHIQFSGSARHASQGDTGGPVKEGEQDKQMMVLRDKLKNHHNPRIWEELGKICLECGKCTIVCPTCFCFRIDDQAELGQGHTQRGDQTATYGRRQRCWDSCFFQEFSEVAGPPTSSGQTPKFLSNTAERIHFWYFHKFARIPDDFNFMGCVGCRRCTKVCPVGIDIEEVLKSIENS